jgi:hypothetical protein
MKYLLTGVAMVAALAITAPVWAQTSTAPTSPPAAAPTPPAAAPTPGPASGPESTRQFMHRVVHTPPSAGAPTPGPAHGPVSTRRYLHHVVHRNSGEDTAEQLNAQELQRIQSGAPPTVPMTPGNPTR